MRLFCHLYPHGGINLSCQSWTAFFFSPCFKILEQTTGSFIHYKCRICNCSQNRSTFHGGNFPPNKNILSVCVCVFIIIHVTAVDHSGKHSKWGTPVWCIRRGDCCGSLNAFFHFVNWTKIIRGEVLVFYYLKSFLLILYLTHIVLWGSWCYFICSLVAVNWFYF